MNNCSHFWILIDISSHFQTFFHPMFTLFFTKLRAHIKKIARSAPAMGSRWRDLLRVTSVSQLLFYLPVSLFEREVTYRYATHLIRRKKEIVDRLGVNLQWRVFFLMRAVRSLLLVNPHTSFNFFYHTQRLSVKR